MSWYWMASPVSDAQPEPLSTDFLQKNLYRMRAELDRHNATCSGEARAFLMHPFDRRLFPFDRLWGVELVEDPSRRVRDVRVDCPQHADVHDD